MSVNSRPSYGGGWKRPGLTLRLATTSYRKPSTLLERAQELYRRADEPTRRILNKAVFNQLRIDHDGEQSFVSGDELNEPFQTVVTYHRSYRPAYKRVESPSVGTRAAATERPLWTY